MLFMVSFQYNAYILSNAFNTVPKLISRTNSSFSSVSIREIVITSIRIGTPQSTVQDATKLDVVTAILGLKYTA